MTQKRKEQLSNRLIMNFAFLLLGALILLYVNTGLRNGGAAKELTYTLLLIAGIVGAVFAIVLFALGTAKKSSSMKNYSAVGLGVLIGSMMIYLSKIIPGYNNVTAVIVTYIAMAVYFVALAIIIGIAMRKPIEKDPAKKIVHAKKRK